MASFSERTHENVMMLSFCASASAAGWTGRRWWATLKFADAEPAQVGCSPSRSGRFFVRPTPIDAAGLFAGSDKPLGQEITPRCRGRGYRHDLRDLHSGETGAFVFHQHQCLAKGQRERQRSIRIQRV